MTFEKEPEGPQRPAGSNAWSPDLSFKYSADQVLEFARFMDFMYERQVDVVQDLLKVVILRTVCQSAIAHDRGCNASSLSDALKIPRETVRRKGEALVRDGWLRREGNQFLPGPAITQEILDMVDGNIDRMMAAAEKVRKMAR